jgi:elongation factor G
MAFKMAGIFACKEVLKLATPILLEPVMKVEVTTPEESQGDIMGDLNRRRGQIQHMDSKKGMCIIHAMVPLENMFGYATDVRSLTKGRASYSMEPSHFEEVPPAILPGLLERIY